VSTSTARTAAQVGTPAHLRGAGNALRSLLFQQSTHAEEAATTTPWTTQSLTSRSSQSGPRSQPASQSGVPPMSALLGTGTSSFAADSISTPGSPYDLSGVAAFSSVTSPAQGRVVSLPDDSIGSAMRGDSRELARQLLEGFSNGPALAAPGQTTAMQTLDASLHSFRAEVAALHSLQAGSQQLDSTSAFVPVPSGPDLLQPASWSSPGSHHSDLYSRSQAHRMMSEPASVLPPSEQSQIISTHRWGPMPAQSPAHNAAALHGRPVWVEALPPQVQGRLAGCTTPLEALEVLEEVLDHLGLAPAVSSGASTRPVCTSLCTSRSTSCDEAQPELLAASVDLLRSARARVENLEKELQDRRRNHEKKLKDLRHQQRSDKRRMLRRLLQKLAPPRAGAAEFNVESVYSTPCKSAADSTPCKSGSNNSYQDLGAGGTPEHGTRHRGKRERGSHRSRARAASCSYMDARACEKQCTSGLA